MLMTRRAIVKLLAGVVPVAWMADRQEKDRALELVYLDPEGVIRWKSDGRGVALFGANYCLPSASDYRAAGRASPAGYVGADRKKLIEQDMAHFARMGWDGLRLSFWGDWENSDKNGNLIQNDHLDLLDYLIARASERGIFMLLSPIVTHSSLWPDGGNDPSVIGFSRQFPQSELGTNPEAIAAQANYLRQLLRHVNPYTGRALKDEPHILFIEMINEPIHHSSDFDGSVAYINALVDAVRSTGCEKILFHNVSQDFGMAGAIRASKAQGSSFGWYPSGLVSGRELRGNFLRTVDAYPQMLLPELAKKAKIVYEFDMADVMGGYAYPAMSRTFRSGGAQFAAMFSYDMLATAPYNLGWQTHCLNLVYTPQKAASAIIAGEAMRRLPRLRSWGDYPANTRFGDFRVSYEENLSERNTPKAFLYSNDTTTPPVSPDSLQKIVGYGSSPVIGYEGKGLYFLDKIEAGVWRLEVYPDAIQIDDPYAPPRPDRTVFRLISGSWPMRIRLADLGRSFRVTPLDSGNPYTTQAADGRFRISPGVFLLTAAGRTASAPLPEKVGGVGLREFVCPAAAKASPGVEAENTVSTATQVAPDAPLVLFDPGKDAGRLDRSRALGRRRGGDDPPSAYRFSLPRPSRYLPEDVTASLYIGDRIGGRGVEIGKAKALVVAVQADAGEALLHVTLVEKDGTAWSAPVKATAEGKPVVLPLSEMTPARWVLLPQGFPGDWAYWAEPTRRSGTIHIGAVERLQFSLRKADLPAGAAEATAIVEGVAIGSITLASGTD